MDEIRCGIRTRIGSVRVLAGTFVSVAICAAPLLKTEVPPHRPQVAAAHSVLDVMRVEVNGDAANAVVHLPAGREHRIVCDLVILGGGMGGVSAAYEASRVRLSVCIIEATLWLGGQMTSQGVSAFDDNKWIKTAGATATYRELSHRIRAHYEIETQAGKDEKGRIASALNPGKCWVSSLCFEPRVGSQVLDEMLRPFVASHRLVIRRHTVPVEMERHGRRIESVLAYDFEHRQWLRLVGKFFVDATELGDGIRLSGLKFRAGAESKGETGERDAPERADRSAIQSFTYPFLLLNPRRPSIPQSWSRPPHYDDLKKSFSLSLDSKSGKTLRYGMFAELPGTPGAFWTYRRVVDAGQFRGGSFAGDLSMINWAGNDYCDSRLLADDPVEQARALQGAKQLALGFAWWLQHEVPRDNEIGLGYPMVALQLDGMGSRDGLSQQPYIRESRRIVALQTVVEEDISVDFQRGARAAHYKDTVGIGQYPIDIHSCGRNEFGSETRPYEIPLGALIPQDVDNLLAASKNIGTTHITNGAYRLHPTEWSIGEAAGAVVAWSVRHGTTPVAMDGDPQAVAGLQQGLVEQGHPIFWLDDVPQEGTLFRAAQIVSTRGWLPVDKSTLHFSSDDPLSGDEVVAAMQRADIKGLAGAKAILTIQSKNRPTWRELSRAGLDVSPSEKKVTRGDFAIWLLAAVRGNWVRRP